MHVRVVIEYPDWLGDLIDWERPLTTREERMRLAIHLASENVRRGSGGPFGAVIVEHASGRLISVGTNAVVRENNSTLHGEMIAFMMAQQRLGSYTLAAPGMPVHELVTSCEPCAMCLGAVLWSGVKRVVCGATRDDAISLAFEEGPVFPDSYRYLEERGISFEKGVLREDATRVMADYQSRGGEIYNA